MKVPPPVKSSGPRRLRTHALLATIEAPELERYLDMKVVDFSMTDQTEALLVRVRRGVEVLDARLEAGLLLARRLCWRWSLTAAVLLAAAICLVSFAAFALATLLLCGLALIPLGRALADTAQLQGLRGKHQRLIELVHSREQLLALAQSALADARAVGAAPAPDTR